jgi:type I restriction enzyme R subunit
MREEHLPRFYRDQHPKWSDEMIATKIANITPDDMDDAVEPSFYDENPEHIKLVVSDIFTNWRNRSNEGEYNALFTTHVGGRKASTPMAMMYFKEFQRVNDINKHEGKQTLRVAVTFSQNTTNNDSQLETNQGLFYAVQAYNEEFGTSFSMDDVSGYTQDITSRLNKTASDGVFLDIVIVVDQLLTGFDAPKLNTLYVDRTLQGAGLIQAYSRTNRIADMQEKPWGRIVNYRWPAHNEKLMNQALAVYANKDSANLSDAELIEQNTLDGITAPGFEKVFEMVKSKVAKLAELTDEFTKLPPSEKQKEYMLDLLREYNTSMAKLKQYEPESGGKGFDYDNPDEIIISLGMTPEQEVMLTTVLTNELKTHISKEKKIPLYQIELRMTHVKDVMVNYDYLTMLVEQLINEVHDGKTAEAIKTQDRINQFANGLEDRNLATRIINAAVAIIKGFFPPESSRFKYPAKLTDSDSIINEANNVSLDRTLLDFRVKWGITEIITSAKMRDLFSRHHYGQLDLDDTGQIRNIIARAGNNYKTLAHDEEVQNLSKIKYRNSLREAIYEIADELADS